MNISILYRSFLKAIPWLLWPLSLYGQLKEKSVPHPRPMEEYIIPIDTALGIPVPRNFTLFCTNTLVFFNAHFQEVDNKQSEILVVHVIKLNQAGQLKPTIFQHRRGKLAYQNLVRQYEKSILTNQKWLFKSAYSDQPCKRKEYSCLLRIKWSKVNPISISITSLDETHEFSCFY